MSPKYLSSAEAIHKIKPGSTIFIGESCGEPQTLVEALVADRERLKGSRIIECRRFPVSPLAGLTSYFKIMTLHPTSDFREVLKTGLVDFIPFKLSEGWELFEKTLPVDVAMIQVAPPLDDRCSLSIATGFTRDAALNAKTLIAEVNQRMPYSFGNNFIDLDCIDIAVETSRPLLEYSQRNVDEVEKEVGRNIARLIDDGSSISIGIGGISETVVDFLEGKHDIGIHSGMIIDGIADAMRKGIITNRLKTINKGKTVAGLAIGSQKLFDYLHENPEVEMHPFSYTHDINNMSRIENFIAINTAIEIDLTGQVNAESLGAVQMSAIGGQADFIRGANLSRGGKAIIALSSTTRDGRHSKIVPALDSGTIISTPRHDVNYVVTEYGIVDLRGQTLKQRAEALISIAHPKFRDELYTLRKSL